MLASNPPLAQTTDRARSVPSPVTTAVHRSPP